MAENAPDLASSVDGGGKFERIRKVAKRKAVDFNSSLITYNHSRVLFPDNLNRPELQPSIAFDKDLLPVQAVRDNPASCVCTKLADTSINKNNQYSHRCPVFAIAWTPEGRGLIAGNSQGEFTLWDGFEFNFLTIWQVRATRAVSILCTRTRLRACLHRRVRSRACVTVTQKIFCVCVSTR